MNFLSEPSPGSSLQTLHFVNSTAVNSICWLLPKNACFHASHQDLYQLISCSFLSNFSKLFFSRQSSSLAHLILIPSCSVSNYLSVSEMATCSPVSIFPLFGYRHITTELWIFPALSCWSFVYV